MSLDSLCAKINRERGSVIVGRGLTDAPASAGGVIPFSSPRMNYMTYGGLPRGRVCEIHGAESAGKSSLCLDLCGNAQKVFRRENPTNPKAVVYIDVENTLDDDWARSNGCDLTSMYIMKPEQEYAEDILDIALSFIDSGEVGLLVIDSLAMMVSKAETEKKIEERTVAGISTALTIFSKKVTLSCKKNDCLLIGINQLRDTFSTYTGAGPHTPGGRAWKHACSVRLQVKKGDYLDEQGKPTTYGTENPHGNIVIVSVVKTKAFKPDRKVGTFRIMYDRGIDPVTDYADIALKCGDIVKAGGWYTFVGTKTGEVLLGEDGNALKLNGWERVLTEVKTNPKVMEFFYENIGEELLGPKPLVLPEVGAPPSFVDHDACTQKEDDKEVPNEAESGQYAARSTDNSEKGVTIDESPAVVVAFPGDNKGNVLVYTYKESDKVKFAVKDKDRLIHFDKVDVVYDAASKVIHLTGNPFGSTKRRTDESYNLTSALSSYNVVCGVSPLYYCDGVYTVHLMEGGGDNVVV